MKALGCAALLALAILINAGPAAAQVVNFPDPNLEAAIRTAISKPTGPIMVSDLVGVGFTTFSAPGAGIANLTGLEACADLINIALNDNLISNLNPLSGLINLNLLQLQNNLISDITPLSGLINLNALLISNNSITNIAVLENLTILQIFHIRNNPLQHINVLQALPNLNDLQIDDVWAPRVVGAVANDTNDNGVMEAGETIGLIMDQGVTVSGLTPASFVLPVAGDDLGGGGFNATISPSSSRVILLRLGVGANLRVPGVFSFSALSPGSPSGIDIAAGLPLNAIRGFNGVAAVPSMPADMLFTLKTGSADIGAGGGTVSITPSQDALYSLHVLTIPPGALSTSESFTLRPPFESLGVLNAVQITTGPALSVPVTLTLEYTASDLDPDSGHLEKAMRIKQLFETSPGVYVFNTVPGVQQVDPSSNTVSVELNALNRLNSAGGIGIYAALPGDTIGPVVNYIKPSGGARGAAIIPFGPGGAIVAPGAGGDYLLHQLEFPNYVIAASTDTAALRVDLTPALLLQRSSSQGFGFPSESGAVMTVKVSHVTSGPIAFSDPVNLRVQFMKQTDKYNDIVHLDETSGLIDTMRIVRRDYPDAADAGFQFISDEPQSVNVSTGYVEVSGITNLTGSSGFGVWGAAAQPIPSNIVTRTNFWEVYE